MVMLLGDSKGGIGAKYVVLLLSVAFSWRATSLESILRIELAALVDVDPPHNDGWPARLLKCLGAWALAPDTLAVEVQQLLGTSFLHEGVFEDLLRHVVDVLPAVSLQGAAEPGIDLQLVVEGVQSAFASFHHASRMELVTNAADDGLD